MTDDPRVTLESYALSQERDWREMGFTSGEKYGEDNAAYYWNPAQITGNDVIAYSAKSRLGSSYALDLIGHMRRFPGDTPFSDVMKEIVKRGQWTALEIGFFETLARAFWGGDFPICTGEWVAVPDFDTPAREAAE